MKSLGHHAMLCPFHLLHCKFYSELQFGNASNYLEKLFSDSYIPLSVMIYPLDSRNTKKIKKTKTKNADFFVNTRISVKFFQKKKSQNNNITIYEKFKK